MVPHALHGLPLGRRQGVEHTHDLLPRPALAIEHSLPVAFVAGVERHHQHLLARQAAANAGVLRLALQLLHHGAQDLGQRLSGLSPAGGLEVAGIVGAANQVLPGRSAIPAAIEDPRPGGHLDVSRAEALDCRQAPAQHGCGGPGVGRPAAAVQLDAIRQLVTHRLEFALRLAGQQLALRAPQVLDLLDGVAQAPQLVQREIAPGRARRFVEQFGRDVNLLALLLLRSDPGL